MPFEKHNCNEHLEVRERRLSGGSSSFVRQCMVCGEQRGNALNKKGYLVSSGGVLPKCFDDSIFESYRKKPPKELEEAIKRQQDVNPKRTELTVQLEMLLDNFIGHDGLEHGVNIAQRCLNKYKKKRFERGLASLDRFSSEQELKEWLETHLSEDFNFKQEVEGNHLAENKGVKIDYLLQAKPHLIAEGFTPEQFGIEVKYIPQEKGFTRKLSRAFWQTISYNDCQFRVEGAWVRPKFCLLFSNLSFHEESKWLNDFEGDHSSDFAQLHIMNNIASHARVGTLVVRGAKSKFSGWVIKFSSANYFSSSIVREKWKYKMSNKDIINKVRIGNF